MRRFTSISVLLLATAAVACGDDSAATTSGSDTGSGGDDGGTDTGTGGAPAQTTTGSAPTSTTTTSTGDPTTTTAQGPTSTSSGTGGEGGGPSELCGNGEDDPGEECDDENTTDGDGCSADCTLEVELEVCGNGLTEPSVDEECDDGNDEGFDGCEADCTISPEIVECARLAPGPCTVDPGSSAKILVGDVLLPYTTLRGGQVAVDDAGTITCVGCDCEAIEPDATVVTCPEGVISPGLINTHEHITYAHNDPATDTGERYEHRHDWRVGGSNHNNHTPIPYESGGDADVVRWGELRFLMSGATSLVGSGTGSGFLRNLDRADKEGLDVPSVHFETFPLDDAGGATAESGCGEYDIDSQQSIALDLAYLPHVSEGIDQAARNEFVCVSGSENDGEDLLENHSAFIHAIGLQPADYAEMATEGTTLIWSPRSNIVLYGNTAQVTVAAREGVNIALGTDWIVSGSYNMFRELQCAALLNDTYYDGFFSRRDMWRMVTVNAARGLGLEKTIGTLAVGTVADIAIFDGSDLELHAAVVDAATDGVHLVLRGGEPLFGDTAILDELPDTPATCEAPFDTCMADKTICVQSEVNMTYAAFRSAAGNLYGPYFCAPPADEPTCVPMRPEAVNGSTTYDGTPTAGDDDGDGIDDGEDNCPTVFNPIRPVDDGVQADADGDDVGDACDVCPRDADTEDCSGVNPADEDADGIPTFYDNCPYDPNITQADNDEDGKGNLCDQCPDTPNPGLGPCPFTIYDVKTSVAEGTVVALTDVLVTACIDGRGFTVQHAEGDAQFDGLENSAVYVFNPDTECGSTVAVGDRLDISEATTDVYFEQIQLGFATFAVVGQDTLPDPVVLTPAEASGTDPNEWEAILARVEDVTVTDPTPTPAPSEDPPTGEFEVGGSLRVDNYIYTSMPLPAQNDTFQSITGVLLFHHGNQKLEPRDASDLVE